MSIEGPADVAAGVDADGATPPESAVVLAMRH
jgi:hypothetical protein